MKSPVAVLALTTALTFPELMLPRPVTLVTTLNDYGDNIACPSGRAF